MTFSSAALKLSRFGLLLLTLGHGLVWAGTTQRTALYRLNSKILRDSDPVWLLLKEDSSAGTIGRFAVSVGSGVEWLRSGYHRQVGLFDVHVREADMPGERPGVRSSIGCNLARHIRFDLINDAIIDNSPQQVQSANLRFQIRTP